MSRITVDLTGKVAFITGGGSGIGRGFGLQMAACGAAVIVTDLNGQAADRVAAEIVAAGGQALALPVDVADAAALDVAVAAGIARFGQIDFLFANAGVLGPADYLDITPDDWDLVMDVNIKGVALTCRAVATHMMERKQGRILMTASYNGVRAGAHVIPYRVSKAAVLMYTRCLAMVMAPYGVTVNAICPGVTLTPMQLSYAE
ncbi:MAG: SDR family NAD(P)-dependent oxidoreductase, partial [Anaerolineae bacterium]|nr:SDR family NAD(P)-dependent oxidoreductase [Anaerolineae bacterium]